MTELRDISFVVQNLDCSLSYDILQWENEIRKARKNSINIQTACIPYDRVNEFIQAEGNNVLAPTSFYQSKVENDTDMKRARVNKNNFIKHIWYVTNKSYVI
jgi:hypothetical protein